MCTILSLGAGMLLRPQSGSGASQIEYGKYLVEEVAKCQECHAQRLPDGQLDSSKWMKGAVLNFQPIEPVQGWHKTAPDLTSGSRLWQKWGDSAMLKFLITGQGPKGTPADPPMPAYKLKQQDAEAMLAYLKSLK